MGGNGKNAGTLSLDLKVSTNSQQFNPNVSNEAKIYSDKVDETVGHLDLIKFIDKINSSNKGRTNSFIKIDGEYKALVIQKGEDNIYIVTLSDNVGLTKQKDCLLYVKTRDGLERAINLFQAEVKKSEFTLNILDEKLDWN